MPNHNLRILHVGKYYPPFAGGIEYFHRDLVREQIRQHLQVASVVHAHEPGKKTVREEADGAVTWRVRTLGRAIYTPLAPGFRRVLRQAIEQFAPDVLHFHLPNPSALWATTLRAARRTAWVAHWHSDIVPERNDLRLAMAYRVYAPFERMFLSRCAAIVATSPPYLESSRPLARWREKCHVVPLGIERERLPEPDAPSRQWAEQTWRPEGLRVLAVGRLTHYKGQEQLLRAVADAPQTQLCLVGTGDLQQRIERSVGELALGDRAQLLGFLSAPRVRAMLASCDCLCLPSLARTEAFGLVLPEAMRYGKPAVASRIPGSGVGWVVEHDRTGLLVTPGDVGELSASLRRMAQDQTLRQRLGAAAAEAFDRRFGMPPVATAITEIYRSVCQGGDGVRDTGCGVRDAGFGMRGEGEPRA